MAFEFLFGSKWNHVTQNTEQKYLNSIISDTAARNDIWTVNLFWTESDKENELLSRNLLYLSTKKLWDIICKQTTAGSALRKVHKKCYKIWISH